MRGLSIEFIGLTGRRAAYCGAGVGSGDGVARLRLLPNFRKATFIATSQNSHLDDAVVKFPHSISSSSLEDSAADGWAEPAGPVVVVVCAEATAASVAFFFLFPKGLCKASYRR
jgi:hypothetical protein